MQNQTCCACLNAGKEDEMQIIGYRPSRCKRLCCWICIIMSCGLLRLILHWWHHWYLLATHDNCPLEEAESVLIEENFQGQHKVFHVAKIDNLQPTNIRQHSEKQNDEEQVEPTDYEEQSLYLSAHFSAALFQTSTCLRVFRCKEIAYAWDKQKQQFNQLKGLDIDIPCAYYYQQAGLTQPERLSRRVVYGANCITAPFKSSFNLLCSEALNPYYVFQLMSVTLWYIYHYYYYASVIVILSIIAIYMVVRQTLMDQEHLQSVIKMSDSVMVVDSTGGVLEVPASNLVPGDIIEIPTTGCTLQCDAVLLSGNCILDESMLTGECVPITKTPLTAKAGVIYDKKEHARNTLYCGTKIVQTRYVGSQRVRAFVTNTGNLTAKGVLIRSILFPPPVDYKFEQDSYKFIQCLAMLACFGFLYTLITKIQRGIEFAKIAVEALDLITIAVPPALPATMTVGRMYAQIRLRKNKIYCISPRAINVAGSINCCCFDKTGTLTEDGLDLWGIVPCGQTQQFQIPMKDVQRLPLDHFLFGMVTCHSISVINETMVGDPLDLKMFESTGWIFEDTKNIPEHQKLDLVYPTVLRHPNCSDKRSMSPTLPRQSSIQNLLADAGLLEDKAIYDHGIVREFPFAAGLQRMSVITRCLSESHFNVYCKGSPEALQQLCKTDTLPPDYQPQLSTYARRGYRVIAMGYKQLDQKINYARAQRLSREDVEHDLHFLGFIIIENRLKADTTGVISTLKSANIRTIMATGDNVQTALSVARDCGIVGPEQAVVTAHHTMKSNSTDLQYELVYTLDDASKNANFRMRDATKDRRVSANGDDSLVESKSISRYDNSSCTSLRTFVTWTDNDNEADAELGSPIDATTTFSYNSCELEGWRANYSFATDGKTFTIMRDQFPELLPIFLTRGTVYARMKPDHKQALIVELQKLGYYVAMCGDGANDCGALKAAHAGVSLSENHSSIASPFTSTTPTIASVVSVIREGRAALVTSFGTFKYMAAYSLIQFISVMILYSIDSNLTDMQYLYIDLGLITTLAFFFGRTSAYSGPLSKEAPLASLISPAPLISVLLHVFFAAAFQISGWIYLRQQLWFEPFKYSSEDHLGCAENYVIFAISAYQYIVLAFVLCKGAPYRAPIWSNRPFCGLLILNACFVTYLLTIPHPKLCSFFDLVLPPNIEFRLIMVSTGIAYLLLSTFAENIIVDRLVLRAEKLCQLGEKVCHKSYKRAEFDLSAFERWPQISEVFETFESLKVEGNQASYVNITAEHDTERSNVDTCPKFF